MMVKKCPLVHLQTVKLEANKQQGDTKHLIVGNNSFQMSMGNVKNVVSVMINRIGQSQIV